MQESRFSDLTALLASYLTRVQSAHDSQYGAVTSERVASVLADHVVEYQYVSLFPVECSFLPCDCRPHCSEVGIGELFTVSEACSGRQVVYAY